MCRRIQLPEWFDGWELKENWREHFGPFTWRNNLKCAPMAKAQSKEAPRKRNAKGTKRTT